MPKLLTTCACACALACALCALGGCLEETKREQGQWPIARAELLAAAQKTASAAPADPGEAAYRKTCIACHGVDGKGNGGKTAADFSAETGVLKKQDSALLGSIRDGVTGPIGIMPPHRALLSEDEVGAVLAYVRRSFGPGITPEAAPDAAVPATTP